MHENPRLAALLMLFQVTHSAMFKSQETGWIESAPMLSTTETCVQSLCTDVLYLNDLFYMFI